MSHDLIAIVVIVRACLFLNEQSKLGGGGGALFGEGNSSPLNHVCVHTPIHETLERIKRAMVYDHLFHYETLYIATQFRLQNTKVQ